MIGPKSTNKKEINFLKNKFKMEQNTSRTKKLNT